MNKETAVSEVVHHPERGRFELLVAGQSCHADYRLRDGVMPADAHRGAGRARRPRPGGARGRGRARIREGPGAEGEPALQLRAQLHEPAPADARPARALSGAPGPAGTRDHPPSGLSAAAPSRPAPAWTARRGSRRREPRPARSSGGLGRPGARLRLSASPLPCPAAAATSPCRSRTSAGCRRTRPASAPCRRPSVRATSR